MAKQTTMTAQESDEFKEKAKRRADVASTFIGFLVGLAVTETVKPVRDALKDLGVSWVSLGLFVVFFLTCIRFFIGGLFHLTRKEFLKRSRIVWFIDFLVISFESTILIFMAGVSNVTESTGVGVRYGFFSFFILLIFVDGAWIIYHAFLYLGCRRWKEGVKWYEEIPWQWEILNLVTIACIALVYHFTGGLYSAESLKWLVMINVLIFVADILLVDRAQLFSGTEMVIHAPAGQAAA
ncbi:MAG: hypothetical protein QOE33_276 [Acidobacteriota bacterium]|nr:hypothetical protein [Acidobacteriota bacterium]